MPSGPINLRRSLHRMLSRKGSRVDLESLLAEMLDAFGGAKMLAHEYKKVYDASAKSPMVQQKVLMMIQQLVHAVTVHNLGKPLEVGQLGDDELDELMLMYMDRMADASPQAAAEAAPTAGAAPDAGA